MENKKNQRSTKLLATFEYGFAEDWFYAVGDFFRDHLDIFLTDRMVPKTGQDGKKRKVKKRVWTQGDLFTLDQGHLFYDSPKKHLIWKEALPHITLVCQIARATPDRAGADGVRMDGLVFFDLWRPAHGRIGLDYIGRYDKTQHAFVEYLKTGEL